MRICELIRNDEAISYCFSPDIEIKAVSTSPFNLEKDFLYIAQRSLSYDIEKSAKALEGRADGVILCDPEFKINFPRERIIRVKNVRRAAAYAYARFYKVNLDSLCFIGVTGTNGKSTTALMIEEILNKSNKKTGLIGTGKIKINKKIRSDEFYSMTTPDVDLLYKSLKEMQDAGCEYVVMEVSSHALYFEKVAPIKFRLSIFTNFSSEHLDFHKSLEEYFQNKLRLFSQSEIGIFNMDDEYSKKAYSEVNIKKHSVAIYTNGDAMAKDLSKISIDKSEYVYREKELIFKIELGLGGIYNVYNSLMAIKAALLLGISPSDIKAALKGIKSIEGKNEIVSLNPTVVIDFAHTPAALENELYLLKSNLKLGQNLIVVFGCGGERDRDKRAKMASVTEKYADLIIVSSDNSRRESILQIFSDILTGITRKEKLKVISSRKKAIIYAINIASKNDLIAIIGKGHERYNIDKFGKHPFDERVIIKEELERLNSQYEN